MRKPVPFKFDSIKPSGQYIKDDPQNFRGPEKNGRGYALFKPLYASFLSINRSIIYFRFI
jgi:hypothetical protein